MCWHEKEPNNFRKIISMAGGPAQLDTIPLATCQTQSIIANQRSIVELIHYFGKTESSFTADFVETILVLDYIRQR